MKIKGEFVSREIANEHILIPVGTTSIELSGMVMLDPVGAFIWEELHEDKTVDDIVAKVLEEFEVDEPTARKDVQEFLDGLLAAGLVE